jgi:hypothetical protein
MKRWSRNSTRLLQERASTRERMKQAAQGLAEVEIKILFT